MVFKMNKHVITIIKQEGQKEIIDKIIKRIKAEHKYKQYWRDKAINIVNSCFTEKEKED